MIHVTEQNYASIRIVEIYSLYELEISLHCTISRLVQSILIEKCFCKFSPERTLINFYGTKSLSNNYLASFWGFFIVKKKISCIIRLITLQVPWNFLNNMIRFFILEKNTLFLILDNKLFEIFSSKSHLVSVPNSNELIKVSSCFQAESHRYNFFIQL